VAVSELRFGDNDSLSALVAILVGADHLFLATDVDALYTSNPNQPPPPGQPPPQPIREVRDVNEALAEAESSAAGSGSCWGTGGIQTKLRAGQLASAAGIATVILSAQSPGAIPSILEGSREVGTVLLPSSQPVRSHKRWIMALPVKGVLKLDAGASRAVRSGSSLFSAGTTVVEGSFGERDAVRLVDEAGVEFARAVVNYAAVQAQQLQGKNSSEISAVLGYHGPEELAKRRNIVLLDRLCDDTYDAAERPSLEERSSVEPDAAD